MRCAGPVFIRRRHSATIRKNSIRTALTLNAFEARNHQALKNAIENVEGVDNGWIRVSAHNARTATPVHTK